MTDKQPTGQEPEYYLITKNEIQQIADSGGISLAIVVRTRPYSPATLHIDFMHSRVKCDKKDCIDYLKEICSPWKCNYYLRHRDERIRQSELENTLKDVELALDNTPFYYKLRWKYKEIIESLRAGKEE